MWNDERLEPWRDTNSSLFSRLTQLLISGVYPSLTPFKIALKLARKILVKV